ncbi:MAG: hypothetical protein V1934_05200 [Methanobacteriota archaeon]
MVSISMDWSKISLLSVIAFLVGWYFFGLLAAVIITLVVLVLMGTIRIKSGSDEKKPSVK